VAAQTGDEGLRLPAAERGIAAIAFALGDQPLRLVSLVLVDVSSIKTRRANALAKKGLRDVIQWWRASLMSGRRCSLACKLFFGTEAKPVQQTPDIGAVNADAAPCKFNAQFIERQITVLLQALAHTEMVCAASLPPPMP
jgi:hypothetical protein